MRVFRVFAGLRHPFKLGEAPFKVGDLCIPWIFAAGACSRKGEQRDDGKDDRDAQHLAGHAKHVGKFLGGYSDVNFSQRFSEL